jgi:hypothetical protein
METVVADHHALSLVDSETFRRTLIYTRPALRDGDILKFDELRRKIIDKSLAVIDRLREEFAVSPCFIFVSSPFDMVLRIPSRSFRSLWIRGPTRMGPTLCPSLGTGSTARRLNRRTGRCVMHSSPSFMSTVDTPARTLPALLLKLLTAMEFAQR